MIGTSIFISKEKEHQLDTSMLLKEAWHKVKEVVSDDQVSLVYSYYDSYPVYEFNDNGIITILEGIIYNMDYSEITNKLSAITGKENLNEIKDSVSSFVSNADGDYLVTILDSIKKRIIVFNDILGGMSVNYYYSNKVFLLSRSLSYVFINSGGDMLDKRNLAEYVTLGYNIGDHTIFERVKKLTPGTCIVSDYRDSVIKSEIFNIVAPNFSLCDKYSSKQEAISDLTKIFLESCKRRVDYAKRYGLKIVNTMSGGYDSRTVLGGLEKYVDDYLNITYEYKQDESEIAKKVLAKVNSKSKYVKLSFDNVAHIDDSKLSYKTDGKIEAYTNSVCYNDLINGKETILGDNNILYFGGFGGEFIRHPRKPFLQSAKCIGLSFSPSVNITAGIFNAAPKEVNDSMLNVIASMVDINKNEDVAKFIYNEYYQNYVRCAGEERTRLFYYTVQPMMGKDFVLAIRNRVPLRWAGFRFYTDFLRNIDKRLAEVELYGNKVDIKSRRSLAKKDWKMNITFFSYVRYLQRKYTSFERKDKPIRVPFDLILKFYNKLLDKSFISIDYLRSVYNYLGGTAQLRLLTILEYISECQTSLKGNENNL